MTTHTIHWQEKPEVLNQATAIPQNMADRQEHAWAIAASVLDPEVPAVTIEDLGILRSVHIDDSGIVVANLTPTYSGCPAVLFIEKAVEDALIHAGYTVKIERVLTPAWSSDWITEQGLNKLRAYGIAPPVNKSSSKRALFSEVSVACPQCGSSKTTKISEFGSTACKAHYTCQNCAEPFDYFKCI